MRLKLIQACASFNDTLAERMNTKGMDGSIWIEELVDPRSSHMLDSLERDYEL